jgi:hypothetical protein
VDPAAVLAAGAQRLSQQSRGAVPSGSKSGSRTSSRVNRADMHTALAAVAAPLTLPVVAHGAVACNGLALQRVRVARVQAEARQVAVQVRLARACGRKEERKRSCVWGLPQPAPGAAPSFAIHGHTLSRIIKNRVYTTSKRNIKSNKKRSERVSSPAPAPTASSRRTAA